MDREKYEDLRKRMMHHGDAGGTAAVIVTASELEELLEAAAPLSGADATCTWGEGPDVMVVIRRENITGFGLSCYKKHKTDAGSFGLTAKEAIKLARRLVEAAADAIRLEAEVAGYIRGLDAGRRAT